LIKVIIVGLGVQGKKRLKYAKSDCVATIDPIVKSADFKSIYDVPVNLYNTVILCVPDNKKIKIIQYCINNKKNVLVEKPLLFNNIKEINSVKKHAIKNKVLIYTAYNHRFEPNIVKMKKLLESKKLGKIHSCKIFYGNGTAKLVKKSKWRDQGQGVITDIGSHLLDITNFWFKNKFKNYKLIVSNKFENKSPDHAIIIANSKKSFLNLEMSLCSWKNSFRCDVYAQKGSAHIDSFCKWGTSYFSYKKRVYPSGKPKEYNSKIRISDPTWLLEYKHFKKILLNEQKTDFNKDAIFYKILNNFKKKDKYL
tara:strand:- start:3310 stop:4236 length:927 start_codon:yes stop_codon:yes gene_type:complete